MALNPVTADIPYPLFLSVGDFHNPSKERTKPLILFFICHPPPRRSKAMIDNILMADTEYNNLCTPVSAIMLLTFIFPLSSFHSTGITAYTLLSWCSLRTAPRPRSTLPKVWAQTLFIRRASQWVRCS